MKKTLALTTAVLILALAPYILGNLRKPSTTVLAQRDIESCDGNGNTRNVFNLGDPVYIKGSGLEPGSTYHIYIVRDYSAWATSETHISDLYIVEGPITIDINASGHIENQPVLIWESASQGYYDIWADSQTDGETGFYDECDVIDDLDVNDSAGFFVVSEVLKITITVLFAYLLVAESLKRRSILQKKEKHKK
ncbi:MAG: hypothetical protein QW840_01275 [Candidatus Bathyarchaeia archaeon]